MNKLLFIIPFLFLLVFLTGCQEKTDQTVQLVNLTEQFYQLKNLFRQLLRNWMHEMLTAPTRFEVKAPEKAPECCNCFN